MTELIVLGLIAFVILSFVANTMRERSGYAIGVALILLLEAINPLMQKAIDPLLLSWLQQLVGGAIGVGMVAWWFIHHDGKRPAR